MDMASLPSELGLKIMHDLLARGDKDDVSDELGGALSLLHLSDLQELEDRLLATEAFLKPWTVFRDSIFTLKPGAIADVTVLATRQGVKGISRRDVLSFYTQFDEDTHRHNPREIEDRFCVAIDKRGWRVEDYEKHLFAWLLQTFKVGQSHNPWGFDFFKLQSFGHALQAVFLPVVNAVRASYSIRGRRHYGRLALFVEGRCPFDLALSKENLSISYSKPTLHDPDRVFPTPRDNNGVGMLTRRHYDEAEKELRTVYPLYGGLVERPKFKIKMEEWLEEQRARVNLRKAAERTREALTSQPTLVKRDDTQTPTKKTHSTKQDMDQDMGEGVSPIRRYSGSIRQSLSRSFSKKSPKEKPNSPLHGVTRQLHTPDDPPSPHLQDEQDIMAISNNKRSVSAQSSDTSITTWPRPDTCFEPSEQNICDSRDISGSDSVQGAGLLSLRTGGPSAIPRLLHKDTRYEGQGAREPSASNQNPHTRSHIPGYEIGEQDNDASMTNLKRVKANACRTPEPTRPKRPATRLPAPIKPTPYYGNLRVASENSDRSLLSRSFGRADTDVPQPVAWPGTSPTDQSILSALNDQDDIIPPIPTKSSRRLKDTRGQIEIPQAQQMPRYESDHNVIRIVSKENIRSALRGHSRDSSAEDQSLSPCKEKSQNQDMDQNSGGKKLQTYNTHMFPRGERRKGTPVGGWVGAPKSGSATG